VQGDDGTTGWQVVWSDEPAVKPGQRVSKKRVPAPLQALGFTLDELRESRLAPIVSFKGRSDSLGSNGDPETNLV
jgi:ribosome maturation factor RimP